MRLGAGLSWGAGWGLGWGWRLTLKLKLVLLQHGKVVSRPTNNRFPDGQQQQTVSSSFLGVSGLRFRV